MRDRAVKVVSSPPAVLKKRERSFLVTHFQLATAVTGRLDRRRKVPKGLKGEGDAYVGDIDDSSAFESERGEFWNLFVGAEQRGMQAKH